MATDETHPGDEPLHDFDQTNGLVDGLEGDSDGTADGEQRSSSDRAEEPGEDGGQAAPVIAPGGPIHP